LSVLVRSENKLNPVKEVNSEKLMKINTDILQIYYFQSPQ